MTSAEEDFNKVDRITHSVGMAQPCSPATPVFTQWARGQSGHDGRDDGYAWAQQQGLPITKAHLGTTTAECLIYQQQRLTLSSNMAPFPRVISQLATWWQVDYIGPLPSWKGQHFVLTGINTYSGYRFAFLAFNASAKTITCKLTDYFIRQHSILHSVASDRGTYFTAKEVQRWAHIHGKSSQ